MSRKRKGRGLPRPRKNGMDLLQGDFVEHFLALADDELAVLEIGGAEALGHVGDLLVGHGDAALLHQAAALPLGGGQAGL